MASSHSPGDSGSQPASTPQFGPGRDISQFAQQAFQFPNGQPSHDLPAQFQQIPSSVPNGQQFPGRQFPGYQLPGQQFPGYQLPPPDHQHQYPVSMNPAYFVPQFAQSSVQPMPFPRPPQQAVQQMPRRSRNIENLIANPTATFQRLEGSQFIIGFNDGDAIMFRLLEIIENTTRINVSAALIPNKDNDEYQIPTIIINIDGRYYLPTASTTTTGKYYLSSHNLTIQLLDGKCVRINENVAEAVPESALAVPNANLETYIRAIVDKKLDEETQRLALVYENQKKISEQQSKEFTELMHRMNTMFASFQQQAPAQAPTSAQASAPTSAQASAATSAQASAPTSARVTTSTTTPVRAPASDAGSSTSSADSSRQSQGQQSYADRAATAPVKISTHQPRLQREGEQPLSRDARTAFYEKSASGFKSLAAKMNKFGENNAERKFVHTMSIAMKTSLICPLMILGFAKQCEKVIPLVYIVVANEAIFLLENVTFAELMVAIQLIRKMFSTKITDNNVFVPFIGEDGIPYSMKYGNFTKMFLASIMGRDDHTGANLVATDHCKKGHMKLHAQGEKCPFADYESTLKSSGKRLTVFEHHSHAWKTQPTVGIGKGALPVISVKLTNAATSGPICKIPEEQFLDEFCIAFEKTGKTVDVTTPVRDIAIDIKTIPGYNTDVFDQMLGEQNLANHATSFPASTNSVGDEEL
jgi:hypothetical protein